ncbi:hypothetical protein Tco_1060102 [Tanacetum coccineum]
MSDTPYPYQIKKILEYFILGAHAKSSNTPLRFIKEFPLTGFRSLHLAVLVTGALSKQTTESHHRFFPVEQSLFLIESRKIILPRACLMLAHGRFPIFTVEYNESKPLSTYHSDVLAIITRLMRRTYDTNVRTATFSNINDLGMRKSQIECDELCEKMKQKSLRDSEVAREGCACIMGHDGLDFNIGIPSL